MNRLVAAAFAGASVIAADRALDIADQVVVLSSGRAVGAGTPTEIRGTENFFGTYRGLDTADEGGQSSPREQ